MSAPWNARTRTAADSPLRVDNLVVEYPGKRFRAKPFRALTDINITIGRGETLGLVGESGSGKTTLGRAVLGLAPVTGGQDHASKARTSATPPARTGGS